MRLFGLRLETIVIHAALFVVLALWMIPEAYMLSMGLRTPDRAFDPVLFAWPLTFQNFVTVIRDNPLPRYFLNSLIVTLGTLVIVVGRVLRLRLCLRHPAPPGLAHVFMR